MKLAYVSEPAKVVVGHDCFSSGVSLHAQSQSGNLGVERHGRTW